MKLLITLILSITSFNSALAQSGTANNCDPNAYTCIMVWVSASDNPIEQPTLITTGVSIDEARGKLLPICANQGGENPRTGYTNAAKCFSLISSTVCLKH